MMADRKWWEWERPATINLVHTDARSVVYAHKKEWGRSWGLLYGIFKNGMVKYICDYDFLVGTGKLIVNNMLRDSYYKKKMQR